MATLDDVARMAAELPEVTEGERHGHRSWFVGGKAFAWDRPFSKADIRRFGDQAPPDGPILAVCVGDLGEKEAVLAANPDAFFTIPHFDGYSAVLIQLPKVSARALRDAITDGWLACAPPAPARQGWAPSHPAPVQQGRPRELERGEREPSPAGRTRGVVRPAGSSRTGEWGFPMHASVMFLDCPAYMDKTGSVRCGLPAEVQDRYLMSSTDGALESARIRCPRGHWFNGPIESLTVERRPALADEKSATRNSRR